MYAHIVGPRDFNCVCRSGEAVLPSILLARLSLLVFATLAFCPSSPAYAQQAIVLSAFQPSTKLTAANFSFVADGPRGPGWSRPDEIARAYFNEPLPAFFERSLELTAPLPRLASLDWIFTGPHAGFTVMLSPTSIRVVQRYYDSAGLSDDAGAYPSRITRDDTRAYIGEARTLTMVLDSHLALHILLNGKPVLTQQCLFDVTRHQLRLQAPRTRHIVVSGRLLLEAALPATLTVNPAERHQTMLGFGGSPSIPAYRSLNAAGKRQYWETLKDYNLLLDREYPMGTQLKPDLSNMDRLSDATPHYYGDNFPNGEVSDFDYSRHTLDLGGSVIYEMWALPAWATVPGHQAPGAPPLLDAWNRPVRIAADPEAYARIVVGYCRKLQQRAGEPPLIVGIENEVEQPPAVFDLMTTVLRRELDRAGFRSTRIHMADAPFVYMTVERVKALKTDPAAWSATDYVSAHQYDYQQFLANPDLYDNRLGELHQVSDGKPFLATEICLNDPNAQEPSYRLAFQVGQLYHKDLTVMDAEALMYCWLLLDVEQPTFGGSRALLVPDRTDGNRPVPSSFQLRVLGAWSRHITRGMTRVAVHSSDADLLATAFVKQQHATLVVMNRSTQARQVTLIWPGAPVWKQIERTSTYLQNSDAEAMPSAAWTIAPGEIVTLSTEGTADGEVTP